MRNHVTIAGSLVRIGYRKRALSYKYFYQFGPKHRNPQAVRLLRNALRVLFVVEGPFNA